MRKIALLSITLLTITLLLAPFAVARPDDNEREIKGAIARMKELLRKAEELEKRGSHEDARELRRKAEQLEEKIRVAKKSWHKDRGKTKKGGDDLHRVMNDLEAGMRALRKLGGHEEVLAHLKRIAINLREEMVQRERRKKGADRELNAAKSQLKVMRACMHALMKRNKRDAAELMEHAIHALELRLERRRDDTAMKVYRTAPKAGAMVELFMLSSEILADMNQRELAQAAAKLGKQHKARWERERKGDRERQGEGERKGDRERRSERDRGRRDVDGRAHMERVMERVERLEKRLDELTGLLERMLKDRKRER